jgi:hypothetical protein
MPSAVQQAFQAPANGCAPPLVPLAEIGPGPSKSFDAYAPPDLAYIVRIYGKQQLGRELQEYTVDMLKVTAAEYEKRYPGTRPTNRGQNAPLIAYIVEQFSKE